MGSPPDEQSLDGNKAHSPIITVEGKGDDLWLTVPDDADEAAISSVVAAHDRAQPALIVDKNRLNRIAELVEVPRSSWTSAQMRELIYLISQEQR